MELNWILSFFQTIHVCIWLLPIFTHSTMCMSFRAPWHLQKRTIHYVQYILCTLFAWRRTKTKHTQNMIKYRENVRQRKWKYSLGFYETTVYSSLDYNVITRTMADHLTYSPEHFYHIDGPCILNWTNVFLDARLMFTNLRSAVQSLCKTRQCDVSTRHLVNEVRLQRLRTLERSQVKYWNA